MAQASLHYARDLAPFWGLGLLVMGGLWAPGYILTGDLVFGPATPAHLFNRSFQGGDLNLQPGGPAPTARAALAGMEYLLGQVLPLPLLEKLLFLAILVLSGVAMFRLVPVSRLYARYFAGFLYMVNPYTYDRFLAGHLYVLWGYALLPLAFLASWKAMKRPGLGPALWAGFWLSMVAISDHLLPMAWGLFALLLFFYLWSRKQRWARLKTFSIALIFFLALNLPWAISTWQGQSSLAQQVGEMGGRDLEVFKSKGEPLFFNLAALYGFWRGGFYYAKDHLPIWPLLWGAISVLALLGVGWGWRRGYRRATASMLLAGLIGLFLAAGTAHWLSSPVFTFLYEKVPLFKGYREPQKFVALLALGYAFFAGIGSDWIAGHARGAYRHVLGLALLALPLAYTYPMLLGFGLQLDTVAYPPGYIQSRRLVEEQRQGTAVLVLPWHQYMTLSWLERPVPNPGEALFDPPVILGDNIEQEGAYTLSTSPVSRYVEGLIQEGDGIQDWGARLAGLGVSHVVLFKEMDYQNYSFLGRQADLILILDDPSVSVYRNLAYSAERGASPVIGPELAAALASWAQRDSVWLWYLPPGLFLLAGMAYLWRARRGREAGPPGTAGG